MDGMMVTRNEAPPDSNVPRGRIVQLDTLRGISVVLVFLFHALQAYMPDSESENGFIQIVDLGRIGVVVFFLISGFVIVRAIQNRSLAAAKLFWIHRFFRLFPAYWLTIGVAVLLSAAGVPRLSNMALVVGLREALANITMMPHLFGASVAVGVFWTLQVELVFYALITGVILLWPVGQRAYAGLAFAFFALSIAYAGACVALHRAEHLSTDNIYLGLLHLSIMFCGAGIRLHWEIRKGDRKRFVSSLPVELKLYFAAVIGFLTLYTLAKLHTGLNIHSFRAVGSYGLGFAIFLLGIEHLGFSRTWKFLGDRSYSLYLLHMPVIASCYALTLSAHGQPMLPHALFIALTFGLSLGAASAMYWLVERPSNRFGHRYGKVAAKEREILSQGLTREASF